MSSLQHKNLPSRPPHGHPQRLQALTETLDALQRGAPLALTLVNLVGIPGIGKTHALAGLARQALDGSRQVLVLHLNFEGLQSAASDPRHVQIDVLRSLLAQLQSYGPELLDAGQLADLRADDQPPGDLSAALRHLTQLVRSAGSGGVLVLADACERAPRAILAWLETHMLRSLVLSERTLCILSSAEPLTLRELELRLRVRMIALGPLDEPATVAQAAQHGLVRELGAAVFQLTGGHPLANEIAATALASEGEPQLPLADGLRRSILERVVAAILGRVPATLTDELTQALRVVAPLREYDAEMLHYILPKVDESFARYNLDSAYWMVKQLNATALVRWQDSTRALTLDHSIRPMFAEEVRLTEPELFGRVHRAAADYYEQLLREAPRGRNQFLIEYYYHTLYNPDSPTYNGNTFREELEKRLLVSYYSPSRTFADNILLNRLEELLLEDDELQEVFERRHLPRQLLLDTVRAVRREYPVNT